MSKIRQIVRPLLTTALSNKEISRSANASKTTVERYRQIAKERGYTWESLQDLNDVDLDAKFNLALRRMTRKRMPDFAYVHDEMQRPDMTLLVIWEEYRAGSPEDALSYSQFTEHYRRHVKVIDRVMRQPHVPGERVFVDFSGRRPGYIDASTGEFVHAELFVGTLGASNYTFALALRSQKVEDWIEAHVCMFEHFGGVPTIIVPDNLRSAVTRAGPDPLLNRSFAEFAEHYQTVVLPARAYKPRDKAKVEGAVLIVQRWVLAKLRNRKFFSLEELNEAIAELMKALNARPFKRMPGSRSTRFAEIDQPCLKPLPTAAFEYAEWTGTALVDNGYHVLVRQHWYSVPHQLVGNRVEARVTARVVEIFHAGQRIASHVRSHVAGGLTTQPEHAPEAHRAFAERTPEKLMAWAQSVGSATAQIVKLQFERESPALGLPACDSFRRLARDHGNADFESAAQRALDIQSPTVKSVRSLLSTGRYRRERGEKAQSALPLHHNVRGAEYYTTSEEA